MWEDLLPLILHAYYKPTDLPLMQLPWHTSGRAHVNWRVCIPEAAGQVSRLWRKESRKAQQEAIHAKRAAFFQAVVELVQLRCLDDGGAEGTVSGLALLQHESISRTVVKTTSYPYWQHPQMNICIEHYPIDRNQRELICFHATPRGIERPPCGLNQKYRTHGLSEMPHFRVRDKDRTEEQKAEAQAWLAELGRVVLAHLWEDFHRLNDNDWHRQRFHVSDEEVERREAVAAGGGPFRRNPLHKRRRD
jgi:hypothetical protein